MKNKNIDYKVIPLIDLDKNETPEWAQPDQGGSIFFIDQTKFQEGMTHLGEFMGYTE